MIDSVKASKNWRTHAAYTYIAICIFDFILFPLVCIMSAAYTHGILKETWTPLTLQGGGLFHLSFGAIMGVSAYGKTQERVSYMNNGGSMYPPQPSQMTAQRSYSRPYQQPPQPDPVPTGDDNEDRANARQL